MRTRRKMTLNRYRRAGAPVGLVMSVVYLAASLRSTPAVAEEAPAEPAPAREASNPGATYDRSSRAALSRELATSSSEAGGNGTTDKSGEAPVKEVQSALDASPSGGGGVSPQAAALPGGAATQLGMGESFSAQLSTGTVSYSVPITLPPARGHAQPNLGLSYSSGAGSGVAGIGWSIGAPAVARQTDRGLPGYDDRAAWHPNQDRFSFAGMELVPICTVTSGVCAGAQAGEVMPAWSNNWQYFRARNDGTFVRMFWSPDHRTWRGQSKDGTYLELGVPTDGTNYEGALERNPDVPSQIFRWFLVRQYDTQVGAGGQPVNTVVYRYASNGNSAYLTDIVDTSPASAPTSTNLALFAHHAAITYAQRPDVAVSYRAGYRQTVAWRVSDIDVTSKPFTGGSSASRELVRRYHLGYDPAAHRSRLVSVVTEGRCTTAVLEDGTQRLPATNCPRLPPVTFEYQRTIGAVAAPLDSAGLQFGAFDSTIRSVGQSPPHSLDEPDTGLMDINGDGLPDLLATAPAMYKGMHGLFINAAGGGTIGFGKASTMPVIPTADVPDSGVLTLHNSTVAALDFDSDGFVDLIHMPTANRYSVFSVQADGSGGFQWAGREISTSSRQNVKVNLAQESPNVRVADVNADGLVDIVYSSPTELQTFLSLGRFPVGDGQFGQATWTSASTATVSNDPVVFCPPWSGKPVRLSDPDVRLADMNGDGLVDIVRVRDGEVLYWPGRGNGFWGTGAIGGCSGGGQFAVDRHIAMKTAPRFGTYDPGSLLLSDVDGDGLSDLVVVRSQGVEIFLNDNGLGWTSVSRIDSTPFRPAGRTHVRLTDIDGSGTPDILWGLAGEYRYIDLAGGKVPDLLIKVSSGLGQTTHFEYTSSTNQMLAAAAAGRPWTRVAPTTMPVLARSIVRDHADLLGRPAGNYVREYTYRDPIFEGRQREFRGFSDVVVKIVGDASSPTAYQHSVFQMGECSLQFVGTTSDVCTPGQRWQDNWREPLKGLAVLNETYDDNGVYLTTGHTTFELRKLYSGSDGRGVYTVVPTRQDQLAYDTASFDAQPSIVTMDEVVVTIPGLAHTETRAVVSRATARTARLQSSSTVDNFGNATDAVRSGCTSNCPNGVDEIITAHSDFALPAGDTSGWLWRETRSYITGSVNTARRKEKVNSYDAFGNLLSSYDVLSGTLALDRHHAVPSTPTAPAPPDQSAGITTAVQILVEGPVYDAFGNATFDRGPSGRCSNRDYDPDYQQLEVVSRIASGPLDPTTACGTNLLSHRVVYDRGLQQVTDSFDARNQPSRYAYDGFGRLTSTTLVDPTTPGQLSAIPTATITYQLPTNPDTVPYTITVTRAQDGATANTNSYVEEQTLRDGLGRTIVSLRQADSTAGDAGDWVASGYVSYDAKGNIARRYDSVFYSGLISGALAGPPANTPYTSRQYDAFDRSVSTFGFDHVVRSLMAFHAMSTDAYDAADVLATPHQGTYFTKVVDGHARTVQEITRVKVGTTLEQRLELTSYLPSGEVVSITQRRAGSSDVVRTMQYDSMGRRVLNLEPNTSNGTLGWRYAYNDAGDLVGTSDARGCGANYFYDSSGRLLAEDRSPCEAAQAAYTAPNLTTGDGTELFYRYDTVDPDAAGVVDAAGTTLAVDGTLLPGKVASISSLASKAIFRYDARGRSTGVAVRIQKPQTAASQLASRYAPRWYIKQSVLDAADRILTNTSGTAVPELLGSDGTSALRATYTKRGLIRQFSSSYGDLYTSAVTLADGRPQSFTLGDAAATHRDLTYDVNLRPRTVQTFRSAAPLWSSPPPGSTYVPPLPTDDPTRQLMLENKVFSYDEVGNLVRDEDNRAAADWPASAKPVTRVFTYDDSYRLIHTTYSYAGGAGDTWKSPYAAENQSLATGPQPSPQVSFANRVTDQQFQYDWLGNLTQTTDDQQGFWDRSTGDRTMGLAGQGPNQIRSASNRTLAPASTARGDLSAGRDYAGNLIDMVVRRDGACLPTTSSCTQRYIYSWDEVGQLARAQRWDLTAAEQSANGQIFTALPSRAANVDLRYAYDGTGSRVLKRAIDPAGAEVQTLYISGTLEVRRTTFNTTAGDYVVDASTTSVILPAGPVVARVVYSAPGVPSVSGGRQHVLLEFSDQVGSSSFIIDRATGELVEASTYQSHGATESDYRPSRWGSQREPYKFSGKEEDIEVGLIYFGARYYSPYLGVWISPDPVTIHDLGSDLNPYAYVYGSPHMLVDPDGRIAPLLVFAIVVIVAALAAGTTTAVMQANAGAGWSSINWGDVCLSAGVGAAAAAVTYGVGWYVGPAVGAAIGGAHGAAIGSVVGAAAGGAAGGATAYALSNTGGSFSWSGLGQSVAVGAIAGTTGGVAGGATRGLGSGWSAAAGGFAGAAAGYGGGVVIGGQASSWQSFALSLGMGLAASIATGALTGGGGGDSSGKDSPSPGSGGGGSHDQMARSRDMAERAQDMKHFADMQQDFAKSRNTKLFNAVVVSGDGINIAGHMILNIGGDGGWYFDVHQVYAKPTSYTEAGYQKYLVDSGKTEISRTPVDVPRPGGAFAKLDELRGQKWVWGVIPHNCVNFVETVVQAGGSTAGLYFNLPKFETFK